MFKEYIKSNKWLFTLSIGIALQILFLLSLFLWASQTSTAFEAIKKSDSLKSHMTSETFDFWSYIWRSGESMSTYGTVKRQIGYQDKEIPNLIAMFFKGEKITNGSKDPSLINHFYTFNTYIQISVVFICLIGFIGVTNLFLIGLLIWKSLLSTQIWNFKKLLLVLLLNIFGFFLSYSIESSKSPNLSLSSTLLEFKPIKAIKKLQNNKQLLDFSNPILIEVKNLNFYHTLKSNVFYKKPTPIHTLKDINLTINKGSFTVIIGPNGSGKTTLLKALINLHENFEGEILWNGTRLSSISRTAFARHVSYIPQFLNLHNNISVLDFLEFARYPYRQLLDNTPELDQQLVLQAIDKNQCHKLKDRVLNELSGGQQQKIILTSVLVQESEIIVLDEPTSYLDIKNQHLFLEVLSEFHKQGKTIIMILHDLRQSIKYADNLIVLKDGQIRAMGHPNEIVDKELLRDVFKIDCDITRTRRGIQLSNIYAL